MATSSERTLSPPKDLEASPVREIPEHQHEFLEGMQLIFVLVPLTLIYFLVMLDSSIVSTATPQITSDFNSLLDVGWYGGAYQLGTSVMESLSGKVFTQFKTKWTYMLYFAIFEVGSALCGAAQSSPMFIVGRAIAGIGSSGLMNGSITIISSIVPRERQPAIMGLNVALGQIGIACGPLIGGAFTQYATWRWSFYLNLPIGAVAAFMFIFIRIPEINVKRPIREVLPTLVHLLDLTGFIMLAPATVMFLLALQWGGNNYAWNSSTIIGLFVGAGVAFAVFLVWEYHMGDDAMVPFSLLRLRFIWSASGMMFFFMGTLFLAGYYNPIFFQAVNDDSALMSGVHLLPQILAQVLFCMVAGGTVELLGLYIPYGVLGTALSAIGLGLISTWNPSTPSSRLIGYQILLGVGCGLGTTITYILLQNRVPPSRLPLAMGIVIFGQNFGGATFLTAGDALFTNNLRKEIAKNVPTINPDIIISAGARSIRDIVSGDALIGVVQAYSTSINRVAYLGIGTSFVAFLFSLGLSRGKVEKDANETALAEK